MVSNRVISTLTTRQNLSWEDTCFWCVWSHLSPALSPCPQRDHPRYANYPRRRYWRLYLDQPADFSSISRETRAGSSGFSIMLPVAVMRALIYIGNEISLPNLVPSIFSGEEQKSSITFVSVSLLYFLLFALFFRRLFYSRSCVPCFHLLCSWKSLSL